MFQNSSTKSSKNNHPNDDKQPASGNKRTKNSSSCNFCREKKVKCVYLSGGRCRLCINNNRECISNPQKKRGPKGLKKATGSSTPSKTRSNLETLGAAFLRSLSGNGQPLETLIQETRSNINSYGISLAANNEQTLPSLDENLSNGERAIFSGSFIESSLVTNDQSGNLLENPLGISNVRISYSLVQSNPSNSDPISVNSTQETLQIRNFSTINNEQMLSPAIVNRQNFPRTRSPETSRQPSPSRVNRQIRREDRNHELGVGLHANQNSSRSPSPIFVVSMHSDNEPVLQFPEINFPNSADLRSTSPIDILSLTGSYTYLNYDASNNSSNQSSPLINSQAMSMPLLGGASPFTDIITDPQTPVSSLNSPFIDFQTTSTSLLELGDESPFVNFTTDPQATLMSPLELSPYVNFTTDPQATSTPLLELGDASPFVDFTTDPQATLMSPHELSPYVNFSTDPQDTSIPSFELGDTSPLANFTTDPQATSMSSPELEDSTSLINSITDPQTISMDNSEEINPYLSIPPQNFINRRI
ncbi:12581_t:CDS:1 [Dentiscutata heterogama]|uniref:12581_t:CDS:1 n=1 Tax=Dentiscutata heterogama TaxID=1316150 RepID=A0ACA9KHQ1_9GLOM|nr:12581_t:CDS:1 [Dentiscutata heterogama]